MGPREHPLASRGPAPLVAGRRGANRVRSTAGTCGRSQARGTAALMKGPDRLVVSGVFEDS